MTAPHSGVPWATEGRRGAEGPLITTSYIYVGLRYPETSHVLNYCIIHKYNNVYSKVKRLFGKTTRCWIGIKKNKDDSDFNDNATDIIY